MKSPLNRGGLRFFLVLAALVAGQSTELSILAGTPLIVFGLVLHVWAKGCLLQNQVVTMTGPYRFVRHPFYAANALIDAGIAVMSGWWLLQVILPVWWLCIYIPVMRREERHLGASFLEIYAQYKRRVPMILPFRRPLPKTTGGFSWHNHNIRHGRVLTRALRFLNYPLLFFVAMEVRSEGRAFLTDNYCLELGVLALMLWLYGLAWMLERHLKWSRRIVPSALSGSSFRGFAAVAFLILAATVNHFETEFDTVVIGAGSALMTMSVLAYHLSGWPSTTTVGEGLLLAGTAVLCELLWLAPLPILYYVALIMDCRLAQPSHEGRTKASMVLVSNRQVFYHLLLIGGVAGSTLKEMFIERLF